jgi:uncharacterized protein YkwD
MHRPLALFVLLAAACGDDKDPTLTDASSTLTEAPDPTSTGADVTTTTTTDPTGEPEADPVWDTPYCHPVYGPMKWPDPLSAWEDEVVALVNQARATGGDCRTTGSFGPSNPLTVDASLHCSARVHSKDMADRNFFDHTNPDGQDPFDRMAEAGYGSYATQGENIAAGTPTAKETVDGWLASDGHCANMLNPAYKDIGVGAYEGPGEYVYYWTQNFGAKN